MSKSKRTVGRPKTTDLVTFSVKIPRKLQATLDKAASDSSGLPPSTLYSRMNKLGIKRSW